MRRFSVGEWLPRETWGKPCGNENYERLKQELVAAVGEDCIGGFAPYRFIELDRTYFVSNFHSYDQKFDLFHGWLDSSPRHRNGDVICYCGNMEFHITYGNYSCVGECTNCGTKEELYGG